MKMLRRPFVFVIFFSLIFTVSFARWYGGAGDPLSDSEIVAFEKRVKDSPGLDTNFARILDLSTFMREDDGKPFHVVNLFKLHETVESGDSQPSESGRNSLNRFSRSVLPIWLRHATHPVFTMEVAASADNNWDFISAVRYRSRKDFMEIILTDTYQGALPDRLNAAHTNIRIIGAGTDVPRPLIILVLLCVAASVVTYAIETLLNLRRSKLPL